jgi:hypothetical protein
MVAVSAHLTAAEARALGISPPKPGPRTRKTARASYHSRCCTCDEEFHTEAAEERHLLSHHHARYAMVL